MTIQPAYITFSRNITAALLGNQVDTTMELSQAAILFQQLDLKAKGLKKSLGLLQEVKAPSSPSVPLPEISCDILEFSPSAEISLSSEDLTEDEIAAILNNPNLASANCYISGLEASFQDWVKSSDQGGIADPTEEETNLVREYEVKLSTLKQLFSTGSSPTEANYTELYALPKEFVSKVEELQTTDPSLKNKVINFWNNLMLVYNSMASLTYPVADSLTTQIADLALNIQEANRVISIIRQFASSIKDFFTPLWNLDSNVRNDASTYTALEADMSKTYILLGDLYRQLMEGYPSGSEDSLPQDIKDGIDIFLRSLNNISLSNPNNEGKCYLNNLLSLLFAYAVGVQESVGNSQVSKSEVIAALNEEKSYWDQRSISEFDITTAFSALVSSPFTYFGVNIFDSSNTTTISGSNPLFFKDAIESVTTYGDIMSRDGYSTILEGMESSVAAIQAKIDAWTAQSTALAQQKQSLDPSQLNYFDAMNADKKTFVESSPLQTIYKSLMLDKYLPNQQRTLETLGAEMIFSNKAARYMNKLITNITPFQTADIYYSLTIYLRQMNLQDFTDAVGKAKDTLLNEQKRCTTDRNRCTNTIQEIDNILEELESDAEITIAQKRELRLTLKDYRLQLEMLLRNLRNLDCFLNHLTLVPEENLDDVDTAFVVKVSNQEVSGYDRILSFLESFVIEGGQNAVVPGGEQQILQSMESTQQDYTTFNQNQQLALQLESAAIQQEWTMVSASLALLNQIFAKLIRRI
ncbi:CT620/CT621 family type III secretion system effector [Chlamydia avium]|uniref:Effector from type III secretion system family protein n=1 Tax=Chlamydia avium 10DC88 TaxID=1229831 RepID=W8JRS9_9CHLA|nr:CT620/CT621 family type III secretion system effector [Chlamydia avium]AHK63548.1 Effector from type III secretion system family protein [Chlamydia avium 10DC88]